MIMVLDWKNKFHPLYVLPGLALLLFPTLSGGVFSGSRSAKPASTPAVILTNQLLNTVKSVGVQAASGSRPMGISLIIISPSYVR